MNRREFITTAAAASVGNMAFSAAASAIPIIDCHIHLFDQTRPQGAPYSGGGSNKLPALPARYRKLAEPLGIVAAVEIEASPWLEGNQWGLDTMEPDTMMVGTAAHLEPDKPEFPKLLERFHKSRLFLGIRCGNVWGYDLPAQAANPVFLEHLKLLAQAGLTFDSANPRPDLIEALLKLKDKTPELRIVLDHTGKLAPGPGLAVEPKPRAAMEANLRDLAKRPGVYFKLSEIMR